MVSSLKLCRTTEVEQYMTNYHLYQPNNSIRFVYNTFLSMLKCLTNSINNGILKLLFNSDHVWNVFVQVRISRG